MDKEALLVPEREAANLDAPLAESVSEDDCLVRADEAVAESWGVFETDAPREVLDAGWTLAGLDCEALEAPVGESGEALRPEAA